MSNREFSHPGQEYEHDAPQQRRVKEAHKIMTPDEYDAMVIVGWHEVCRNVDGCGGVGVRFLGE